MQKLFLKTNISIWKYLYLQVMQFFHYLILLWDYFLNGIWCYKFHRGKLKPLFWAECWICCGSRSENQEPFTDLPTEGWSHRSQEPKQSKHLVNCRHPKQCRNKRLVSWRINLLHWVSQGRLKSHSSAWAVPKIQIVLRCLYLICWK